jgi:hypothetical protein
MSRLVDSILKQHNIGMWWGGLRNTVSNATMYLSLFNTALLIPMAYVSWVQPWFSSAGVEFPFWAFLVGISVLGVIVLLVEYKLFTPSNFEFWSDQFWKHGSNPITKRLDKQDERLERIESLLKNERISH